MDLDILVILLVLLGFNVGLLGVGWRLWGIVKVKIESFPTEMLDFVTKTVKDNPEAIDSYIQNIALKMIPAMKAGIIGSLSSQKGQVSRELKGVENDLISAGVEQVTGLPIGGIALDLLNKYPVLKSFLPQLLAGSNEKLKSGGGLP